MAAFVAAGTPVPTGKGACAGFTAGKPAGWNNNQHVGVFEGAKGFDTKIFRPVIDCRMRSNTPPFCPVCAAVMDSKTRPGSTTSRDRQGWHRKV